MKLRLTYLAVFLIILSVLAFLPKTGGYIWQPEIINPLSALLFTLLVYLTGHIARSAQSATGILCTAMFVLLFCPDSHEFFNRDETAVMTLSPLASSRSSFRNIPVFPIKISNTATS